MSLIIENPEQPKKFPLWIGVGGVVLALVVIILVSFYIQHKIEQKHIALINASKPHASSAPQGLLFFSVLTKSTTTQQMSGMVSGVFDTNTGMAYDLQAKQVAEGSAFVQQFSFSPDRQWVTFLAAPYTQVAESHSISLTKGWEVYRAQVHDTTDRNDFINIIASSSVLASSDNADYFQEFPSITSDGSVAYSSLSSDSFTALQGNYGAAEASSWSVFIIRPFGTKTKIADGLRPKWVSPTSLAYMKNDGIYLFDLTAQKETLLMRSNTLLTVADGFDVSNDGLQVVLTEPSIGLVTYASVGELKLISSVQKQLPTVKAIASNPVFSPDGSYIALLTHGDGVTASSTLLQIEYLDSLSGTFIDHRSKLDAANIGGMYLTDWR